jgi:hypothetical protein
MFINTNIYKYVYTCIFIGRPFIFSASLNIEISQAVINILKARLQAKDKKRIKNNNNDSDNDAIKNNDKKNNYDHNNDNNNDNDNSDNTNANRDGPIDSRYVNDIDCGSDSGINTDKVYTMMDPCCGSGTNLFMARRYIY